MALDEWGIEVYTPPELEEYVIEKPKGKSPFDIMMSAMNKKFKPTQSEKDSIPEFLFHQILSNDPQTIELAVLFTTHSIPVGIQYDMVRNILPKCYIAYPKKSTKVDDKTLNDISAYYDCSIRTASMYVEIMPPHEIERIQEKFKVGKA